MFIHVKCLTYAFVMHNQYIYHTRVQILKLMTSFDVTVQSMQYIHIYIVRATIRFVIYMYNISIRPTRIALSLKESKK